MKSLFEENGAEFSPCRKYRYILWRVWDSSRPLIQFVGLNPSTASEDMDDPTMRRVKGFANSWGYGGVYMTNLFALVSSNPKDLLSSVDPIADNDKYLLEAKEKCQGEVLFAWGTFKEAAERAKVVCQLFDAPLCLGYNNNGTPIHPLYVPGERNAIPFKLDNNMAIGMYKALTVTQETDFKHEYNRFASTLMSEVWRYRDRLLDTMRGNGLSEGFDVESFSREAVLHCLNEMYKHKSTEEANLKEVIRLLNPDTDNGL